MSARRQVIARDGIALAEPDDDDREAVAAGHDGAFDVDPDDQPPRHKPQPYRLAVIDERTGELLGVVNWHPVGYGPTASCDAWNIGRVLLPSARGRGIGTLALRLLVEYLFATTDVDRIEAGTDVENQAARRSLEKVGFRHEGVLRGAQLRGGRRRDLAAYGLLRTDLTEPAASTPEP